MFGKRHIPWALIWFRAAAAPVPWLLAVAGAPLEAAAALVPLALLSDILDGKIARANGTVTELLRRADGWADNAFTLSYTVFVLIFCWTTLAPFALPIALLAAFRVLRALLDFAKYGRGSAYHFYSAKIWGLSYYTLLFLLLTGGPVSSVVWVMIALGVINTAEGIIATALIPCWIYDAPHLVAALKKGGVWPPRQVNPGASV